MTVIAPSSRRFFDAITDSEQILTPVRSFLLVQCFRCRSTSNLRSVSLPIYDLSHTIIVCSKPECMSCLKPSVLSSLHTPYNIFTLPIWLRERTTPRIVVRRSSGVLDNRWTLLGVSFTSHGAAKVAVVHDDNSVMKMLHVADVIELNPEMRQDVQEFVDHIVKYVFDDLDEVLGDQEVDIVVSQQ